MSTVLREVDNTKKLYDMVQACEEENNIRHKNKRSYEKFDFLTQRIMPYFVTWQGKDVGFVFLEYIDSLGEFYIASFYLVPNYRKKGLAKKVVNSVIELTEGEDIYWFTLKNSVMKELWEKLEKKFKMRKTEYNLSNYPDAITGYCYDGK